MDKVFLELVKATRAAQKEYFAAPRHTPTQAQCMAKMREQEEKLRKYINEHNVQSEQLLDLTVAMMQAHKQWIRSQTKSDQWAARTAEKKLDNYLKELDEQQAPKTIQTNLF